MDPELQRIVNNVRELVANGVPVNEIEAYVASEGTTLDDLNTASRTVGTGDGPSIGPAGPTAQPTFPTLPPMVGGALDLLIQFGLQGATFGAAGALIPQVGQASREIDARNPRMSMFTKGAGSAMSLPLVMAGATGVGAAGSLASHILKNKVIQTVGGGAIGGALLQRLWAARNGNN